MRCEVPGRPCTAEARWLCWHITWRGRRAQRITSRRCDHHRAEHDDGYARLAESTAGGSDPLPVAA